METFHKLFASGFLPHGTCYLWDPRIVWLHVLSDGLITLSYFCIPLALLWLVRMRRDLPFNWIFWMFALFIVGCGTTHLMEIWTVWHATYLLSGIVKAVTALSSVVTAVMLVLLIPKAAALPSPAQLQDLNGMLQEQMSARLEREKELTQLTRDLELRIQKRTTELEAINQSLQKEIALGARTEEALLASQARLSSVIDSAMDAILTVDEQQRIVLFNGAAEKMFCCVATDVIGQSLERFIPERHRMAHAQHVRRFGETGTTSRTMGAMGELWAVRSDGTEFPIEASISQTAAGGKKLFTVILRDVTERKRAEEALRHSQAQLTGIIQSATDAILTVDSDQNVVLFNTAAERMFGCKSCDAVGESIERFIPQRFRQSHGQHIRRFGDTGVSSRAMGKLGSLWGLKSNGEEFPIEAAISQIDSGGKKLFTVIIRDITERKRMEQALRASEERFRLLLDGVKDYAIFMLDPEGRVLSWNDGATRLKGYTGEEIIGQNFSCFFSAEDQAAGLPQKELDIAIREGKFENQGPRVRKDGSTFWAYKILTPMYNEMGELRGFSAISRDISERKQQEEVLREREQALELAPVLIRDMQDRIVTWNQSCENLYGFSKAEALGSVSHKLLRTEFPEPLPAIMERFRRDGAWIGELVHYRRDGSPVVVNSQWGLFSDEQGRPVRIVETNADISERKLVEHQIQELNAELEKRVGERTADLQATNKELEAFTYSVSHDLRAPLRHIAGFSKMLAEEYSGSLAPEARHYLKRIQDGIHRMGTLVDDLLSLTRIGRHELRVQVTGVESIVKDVIAELAPDVEKREVSWEISNLPYVEADPALLRVVFQNLLANAVKYTRPRQKATIEVGQTQIDGERVLFVRDNGVGFNMKYADKLFGVFQRLHRAEDFEGTGVGLATVQRVVQKHGGRIWADAELDKGATFYFTLKNTAAKPAVHDAAKAGGGL